MYLSECNSPATTARWAATLPPPPPRSPMASSLNFETLSTKVLSSRKNYLWPITAQFYSFEKVLAFLGTSGVGHLRVEIDENMSGSLGEGESPTPTFKRGPLAGTRLSTIQTSQNTANLASSHLDPKSIASDLFPSQRRSHLEVPLKHSQHDPIRSSGRISLTTLLTLMPT